MADRLVAEVVRHHKSVPAGESGEIIMTDFTSYAVPFIRFQVDDVGSLASPDEQCPCGRGLPLLNVIEGRINDLFTLPNGSLVSTHIWQKIFRDYGFIRQFQVIQHTKEHIEVLVSLRFTPDAKQYAELKQRLTEFLPGCTVRWVEKEQLVPGPGGKFRHCISHVPLQFNQPLP
jgi:phenylacetate-CoA ligase